MLHVNGSSAIQNHYATHINLHNSDYLRRKSTQSSGRKDHSVPYNSKSEQSSLDPQASDNMDMNNLSRSNTNSSIQAVRDTSDSNIFQQSTPNPLLPNPRPLHKQFKSRTVPSPSNAPLQSLNIGAVSNTAPFGPVFDEKESVQNLRPLSPNQINHGTRYKMTKTISIHSVPNSKSKPQKQLQIQHHHGNINQFNITSPKYPDHHYNRTDDILNIYSYARSQPPLSPTRIPLASTFQNGYNPNPNSNHGHKQKHKSKHKNKHKYKAKHRSKHKAKNKLKTHASKSKSVTLIPITRTNQSVPGIAKIQPVHSPIKSISAVSPPSFNISTTSTNISKQAHPLKLKPSPMQAKHDMLPLSNNNSHLLSATAKQKMLHPNRTSLDTNATTNTYLSTGTDNGTNNTTLGSTAGATGSVHESVLEEELQALRDELKEVRDRKYYTPKTQEDTIHSPSHMLSGMESSSDSDNDYELPGYVTNKAKFKGGGVYVPASSPRDTVQHEHEDAGITDTTQDLKKHVSLDLVTRNIYTPAYPKGPRKVVLTRETCICLKCGLIGWILALLLLSIVGGIFTGGVYLVLFGRDTVEYGDSFTIEGVCQVVESKNVNGGYDNTVSIISFETDTNKDICAEKKAEGYTTKIDNDDSQFEKNQFIGCYTNENCDRIFLHKSNKYHSDSGWIYFGSGCVFVVGCGGLYVLFIIWLKCMNRVKFNGCDNVLMKWSDCWKYYSGKDKQEYLMEFWVNNMSEYQQMDYFIGYYRRKYRNIGVSKKVSHLIGKYFITKKYNDKDDILQLIVKNNLSHSHRISDFV